MDQHRKARLDQHDDLTMTALYNVLKKERRNEDLDESEREIHEQGLVGVLKELHDELDAAVARAYGWDPGLPEEEILQNLVDPTNPCHSFWWSAGGSKRLGNGGLFGHGDGLVTRSGGRKKKRAVSATCALSGTKK